MTTRCIGHRTDAHHTSCCKVTKSVTFIPGLLDQSVTFIIIIIIIILLLLLDQSLKNFQVDKSTPEM